MKTRHYFLLIALLLAAHLTGCRASKPPEAQRKDTTQARPVAAPVVKPPFFLSTPEGSARRQAVRLARANVPRKLGKGAVYAPKASEVVNAYKPKAAVINADTGAIITAIGKNKASAATAPGATATTTTSKGLSWLWLLVPAAGLALWLYRKSIPFA